MLPSSLEPCVLYILDVVRSFCRCGKESESDAAPCGGEDPSQPRDGDAGERRDAPSAAAAPAEDSDSGVPAESPDGSEAAGDTSSSGGGVTGSTDTLAAERRERSTSTSDISHSGVRQRCLCHQLRRLMAHRAGSSPGHSRTPSSGFPATPNDDRWVPPARPNAGGCGVLCGRLNAECWCGLLRLKPDIWRRHGRRCLTLCWNISFILRL